MASGGSGGRIVFDMYSGNYSSNNLMNQARIQVTATGGSSDSGGPCNFGGSGTIFFKNESKLLIFGPGFSN